MSINESKGIDGMTIDQAKVYFDNMAAKTHEIEVKVEFTSPVFKALYENAVKFHDQQKAFNDTFFPSIGMHV